MEVLIERKISAAPAQVAEIMFNPDNDPRWIGGARSMESLTPGALAVGSRVRRHGGFLGRKFSWVTQVVELEPDRYLRMAFLEGPMRGEVCYRIKPASNGSKVSVLNRGIAGFSFPGMAWMIGRSVAADLKRLVTLVESRP